MIGCVKPDNFAISLHWVSWGWGVGMSNNLREVCTRDRPISYGDGWGSLTIRGKSARLCHCYPWGGGVGGGGRGGEARQPEAAWG